MGKDTWEGVSHQGSNEVPWLEWLGVVGGDKHGAWGREGSEHCSGMISHGANRSVVTG